MDAGGVAPPGGAGCWQERWRPPPLGGTWWGAVAVDSAEPGERGPRVPAPPAPPDPLLGTHRAREHRYACPGGGACA